MNNAKAIQTWLCEQDLDGIIIPSTDEYLSEFSPPPHRELGWATGFTGSTGVAIILRDAAALFLDGRYVLQGERQTAGTLVDVHLAGTAFRRAWLTKHLPRGSRIAIDPMKHSTPDLQGWAELISSVSSQVLKRTQGPAQTLWRDGRPAPHRPEIVDYPIEYAGEPHEAKCEKLRAHVLQAGQSALLVADPEDVSWLLNVRSDDAVLQTGVGAWHVVPAVLSRVIIPVEGPILWFVDETLLTDNVKARNGSILVASPESLPATLRRIATGRLVGADIARTPAALIDIIGETGQAVSDSSVSRQRWRKHAREIEGARKAHLEDAAAVSTFMAWLSRTVPQSPVSELDAARQLEAFRRERLAYRGPSMPLMSASGVSGSMPHYVPSAETDKKLNDHPIYWMDSGGQYLGGTTDNTITLALGTPEPKHINAHTAVVKGYIALAKAKVPSGIYGFALEVFARQPLWQQGLDYDTGTGHGVGNYLNIHEGPYLSREPSARTTVPIEAGMIITNEPGYYATDDFGVRIESHLVSHAAEEPGFIEFETISRFPIDPTLIDVSRLEAAERQWLADYHRQVLKDIGPRVDETTREWLGQLVMTHAANAGQRA